MCLRDKELATQKKDYEERKAVMATAKTTYEVKKARKAELATLKTDLAAKIAALGAGDEKTRLEYKLGQLTTEDGGIDVAALKGTYETQQGVFDAKEKELDAARTTAEGTKRENAFAGIKSAYDKLKTEKEKAETQLAVWLAKKRTSRTDEQWEENNMRYQEQKKVVAAMKEKFDAQKTTFDTEKAAKDRRGKLAEAAQAATDRATAMAARASDLAAKGSAKTSACAGGASTACTDATAAWKTVDDAEKKDQQLNLE